MKRILILNLCLLGTICGVKAQQFTIVGDMGKSAEGATVLLNFSRDNKYHQDSALVKDGKFRITSTISEPVTGYIRLLKGSSGAEHDMEQRADESQIFLEPMLIKIKSSDGTIRKATIKGGAGQLELLALEKQLKPYQAKLAPLMDSMMYYFEKKEDAGVEKFKKLSRPVYDEIDEAKRAFVMAHPDSYLSLSLVRDNSFVIDVATFEPLINALSARMKKHLLPGQWLPGWILRKEQQ